MDTHSRHYRLLDDQAALTALAAASSIFSLEPEGDPAERYKLTFRGKGLARDVSASSSVTIVGQHQIDLRMPYSYPNSPPDIRWLTPLWHPCVSFSGFLNLNDAEIQWSEDLPLVVVCERLWDIARGAFLPTGRAANYAAKNWFEKDCPFSLPLDPRPLKDRAAAGATNIVRYERRSGQGVRFAGAAASGEVLFIDENTPTPPLPERQPYVPAGRRPNSEDVFYIGPE